MNIVLYRIFFKIQKQHWWFVTKKEIILDTINRFVRIESNKKILDIGCGSGLMLNALENLGHTSGMDMSDESISFCREIFTGQVEKGFLPDNVPYRDNYFDLITALDVIEHIDDDVESLKKIRSLLVEDGKAIITVPAYMFLWSGFDEVNEHKRRYTLTELRAKISQAGFSIEKISYFNSILFPVVWIVRKMNNILKRNGASDVDMPSKPVNFALRIIFGIEKYILRFFNFPFGVSILAVVKK